MRVPLNGGKQPFAVFHGAIGAEIGANMADRLQGEIERAKSMRCVIVEECESRAAVFKREGIGPDDDVIVREIVAPWPAVEVPVGMTWNRWTLH